MLITWSAVVFLLFLGHTLASENEEKDLLVVAAAPDDSDALRRFLRSASEFNHNVKVIKPQETLQCDEAMDESEGSCEAGDEFNTKTAPLLKNELEKYKYSKDKLILFTFGNDAIINNGTEAIIKKFQNLNARVLFSADNSSDLDDSLKSKFTDIEDGKPYLSHLGVLGYASDLYDIVDNNEVKFHGDDLLFFTQVYLSAALREKHQIKIDRTSEIFQILDNEEEVQLTQTENTTFLNNSVFNSIPDVVIAKESSRSFLNVLGDYLGGAIHYEEGCIHCQEDTIDLNGTEEENLPSVLVGVFAPDPTPFFIEFLTYFSNLDYPKDKMDLYVHLGNDYNQNDLENYLKDHGEKYSSVTYAGLQESDMEVAKAKAEAINLCIEKNCDYYFNVDATAHLEEPKTLKELVQQNRTVIAPLLAHATYNYQEVNPSNIWRSISNEGTKQHTFDSYYIINYGAPGLWNVALVSSSYLINATLLHSKENRPSFFHEDLDADAALSYNLRSKNIFMYASSRKSFGYLVDSSEFVVRGIHSDLLDAKQNPQAWMKRYFVEEIVEYMVNDNIPAIKEALQEPCRDVYLLPFTTPQFIEELMDIIENDWPSDNPKNMNNEIAIDEFGLNSMWGQALLPFYYLTYQVLYEGSYVVERHTPDSFIIRKKGEELETLKFGEDNSTVTIHLALNSHGADYEGGGFRFLRYDCIVKNTRPGWLLAYPGAMTHNYEELETTKGTKYSLVSYIGPIIYDQVQKK